MPRRGGQRGGGKNRGSPPTQPRPAFSFVSERLFISEVSVFIKCSEPDALSLAQILIMTAGLLRQRTPEIFATPASRPAGHFPKKRGSTPQTTIAEKEGQATFFIYYVERVFETSSKSELKLTTKTAWVTSLEAMLSLQRL